MSDFAKPKPKSKIHRKKRPSKTEVDSPHSTSDNTFHVPKKQTTANPAGQPKHEPQQAHQQQQPQQRRTTSQIVTKSFNGSVQNPFSKPTTTPTPPQQTDQQVTWKSLQSPSSSSTKPQSWSDEHKKEMANLEEMLLHLKGSSETSGAAVNKWTANTSAVSLFSRTSSQPSATFGHSSQSPQSWQNSQQQKQQQKQQQQQQQAENGSVRLSRVPRPNINLSALRSGRDKSDSGKSDTSSSWSTRSSTSLRNSTEEEITPQLVRTRSHATSSSTAPYDHDDTPLSSPVSVSGEHLSRVGNNNNDIPLIQPKKTKPRQNKVTFRDDISTTINKNTKPGPKPGPTIPLLSKGALLTHNRNQDEASYSEDGSNVFQQSINHTMAPLKQQPPPQQQQSQQQQNVGVSLKQILLWRTKPEVMVLEHQTIIIENPSDDEQTLLSANPNLTVLSDTAIVSDGNPKLFMPQFPFTDPQPTNWTNNADSTHNTTTNYNNNNNNNKNNLNTINTATNIANTAKTDKTDEFIVTLFDTRFIDFSAQTSSEEFGTLERAPSYDTGSLASESITSSNLPSPHNTEPELNRVGSGEILEFTTQRKSSIDAKKKRLLLLKQRNQLVE